MSTASVAVVHSSFTPKCSFEYTITDWKKYSTPCYSPPFGTFYDLFWQLKFVSTAHDYPRQCSVYLWAVANSEEEGLEITWSRRATVKARLYLKNPITNLEIRGRTLSRMDEFSAKWPGRGFNAFCSKTELPDGDVIIGVQFSENEMKSQAMQIPLPINPLPKNLIDAWASQLEKPEMSNIRFDVKGTMLYANSDILSQRSEYFQMLIQEQWAECKASYSRPLSSPTFMPLRPLSQNFSCTTQKSEIQQHLFQYNVRIPDFEPETFAEMLRYLYTNEVKFSITGSKTDPLSMFCIADKYLITELRQRAKVAAIKEINIENVAEGLFNIAWKYPELKDCFMRMILENFPAVRKTAGFIKIMASPSIYENFTELILEILESLSPSAVDLEKSDN
ncbi:11619_t:CDS:2 [Ambispora gerdemannii]|uniref:11619_t:CDS:1 n=1 Tax=Ambispora gerdemannii TaxID=144530 RepID=A0A9N9AYN0_9GLOM|nr:11619_t:CDS:2 [Ambispora gerdemannii]